jgi:hypothetical protein
LIDAFIRSWLDTHLFSPNAESYNKFTKQDAASREYSALT